MVDKRISANSVRQLLQSAEPEFLWCQRIVGALSGFGVGTIDGNDIINFQMRLYRSLHDIEKLCRSIKQEEKRLVREKTRFKPEWFVKRMGKLALYSKRLREGLMLGRAIGDGFAWFFYERDPNLVDEHLKLQPQLLFPPDLGAAGERIILENIRGVDGKLLLYHGITSILRLGDVSFIDLATMRVACLGELKTARLNEKEISISISMIAWEKDGIPNFPITDDRKVDTPPPPLSSKMKARFQRQKQAMQEAVVRARDQKANLNIDGQSDFHFHTLEKIVRGSHSTAFEFIQAGDGLIIGAWRPPAAVSMAMSLHSDEKLLPPSSTEDMPKWAMKILDAGNPWNSISLGGIGGEESLRPNFYGIPFFAWPVSPDVLLDIGLGRVIVVTMFNRGHLIKRLSEEGFDVSVQSNGHFKSAYKEIDGTRMDLENFDFFFSLVQWSLLTEDAVFSLIRQAISGIMGTSQSYPARVEIMTRLRRSTARNS